MHKHIYIYGVPGTGKSTAAKVFADELDYKYIELDNVRKKTQQYVNKADDPFLYEWTTEAWKYFGELNKETAIKGFMAVRHAFTKYVQKELSLYDDSYVAEATFVDPALASGKGSKVILITSLNEKLHYSRFFVNRSHSADEDIQFRAARFIQEYLIEEAARLGISIVDNNYKLDITLYELTKKAKERSS